MGYGYGIKKVNGVSVKKKAPIIICVGKGKTWEFKSPSEAARVMGMKVPEIYKGMKNNGKNANGLKWYTKDVYDKMRKNKKVKR